MLFSYKKYKLACLLALLTVASFIGILTYFSIFVPLHQSIVANGTSSVSGNHKVIKHPSGGVIQDLLVDENQFVQKGQTLLKLDATQIRAQMQILTDQLAAEEAKLARLESEHNEKKNIKFPQQLAKQEELKQDHIKFFETRRKKRELEEKILTQKIEKNNVIIHGQGKQLKALAAQVVLFKKELKQKESLVKRELYPETSLYPTQQKILEAEGTIAGLESSSASLAKEILELQIKKDEMKSSFFEKVIQQKQETKEQILTLKEKIKSEEFTLKHSELKAPVDGKIVGMQVFNKQGVITQGQTLLHLVPTDDSLIIETLIDVNDIDSIHVGMKSHIRFMAVNQRDKSPALGLITAISADKLLDPLTNKPYFKAKVKILSGIQEALGKVDLVPGMKAEVIVNTEAITLIDFLVEPLLKSWRRAFVD